MTAPIHKLSIGSKAPDFQLPNQDDEVVSLKSFSGKWLVLFFYPRDNTPSYVRFIRHLTERIDHFDALGAKIVGISRNSVKSHINFIQKHSFKDILLLSDTERDAIKKYNAWGVKRTDDAKCVGVKRTTYIIDPKGIIRYHSTDVRIATHAEEILDVLKGLHEGDQPTTPNE